MPVKPEKVKKFNLGPATGWLPGVAAFLCLCALATAAMTLVGVNSEPRKGQTSDITGLSAQGDAALRRLLAAKGYAILVNRLEDGPLLDHGDLEIITLDGDGGTLIYGFDPSERASSSASSAGSSASGASESTNMSENEAMADPESAASSNASHNASANSARHHDKTDIALLDPYTDQMIPNPKRAQHVLYNPLARAVLVVAPKWSAGRMPQNPLWDQGAQPVPSATLIKTLSVLSPVTELVVPEIEEGKPEPALPPLPPGTLRKRNGNSWITFDAPDYTLQRAFTVIPPTKTPEKKAIQKPPETDASAQGDDEGDVVWPEYKAITTMVTLTPVAGQSLFTAPLSLGRIDGLQSISGPNLQPILLGPKGEVILARVIVTRGRAQPKVPVYLLSDPDLLNNQILADPQKVVSALTLIKALTPPAKAPKIVFNLTFNNLGFQHDLLHALSRPPYIGVPLTLLVLALGLMWAAFSRFGPPITAPMTAPLGRGVRVLADNAARLMAMTLKETKLAPAYALMVRDLVLKNRGHIQMAATQNPDDLAEQIGRISHTTDSFLDLKQKAERIATVHQLIDITLKLHAWKTEIDHAHI